LDQKEKEALVIKKEFYIMKLTEAYIRKLILEELLNEEASSSQQTIEQQILQNAKNSPFIRMINQASAQDQLFVVQKFLEQTQIKDPRLFYTGLYNMALKLKDVKPQVAKQPAQPQANPIGQKK
jgi:hypothetical protein